MWPAASGSPVVNTGDMIEMSNYLFVTPNGDGLQHLALFFHLVSPLGIDPYGDGGVLFKEACAVWLSSLVILAIRRRRAVELVERYLPFLPVPARLRAS